MKSKFTQETLHVEYDSNQGSDSSRKHHFVSGKTCFPDLVVSQNLGYLFGGPYTKDYNILGSILGSPYFGKLPLASSDSGHAKLCFMRGMKRAAVRDATPTLHPKLVSTKVVSIFWVAVKELKLSYHIGETLLFTIYTHYGNLI